MRASHCFAALKCPLLVSILALLSSRVLAIPRNISIDDSSSSIIYTGPNWIRTPDGTNGGHYLATASGSFATFQFKGIALYFLSPKWPYPVGTELTLSTEGSLTPQHLSLDLEDHRLGLSGEEASLDTDIVAVFPGLPNIIHTLRVDVGTDRAYAVVDQIIYTVDDDDPASSASSTFDSSSSSLARSTSGPDPSLYTDSPSASSLRTRTISSSAPPSEGSTLPSTQNSSSLPVGAVAGIGASAGIAGILLILALLWLCRRHQGRKPQNTPIPSAGHTGPHTPAPMAQQQPFNAPPFSYNYANPGSYNPYPHPNSPSPQGSYTSGDRTSYPSDGLRYIPRVPSTSLVHGVNPSQHSRSIYSYPSSNGETADNRGTWFSTSTSTAPLGQFSIPEHPTVADSVRSSGVISPSPLDGLAPPEYQAVASATHQGNTSPYAGIVEIVEMDGRDPEPADAGPLPSKRKF